MEESLLSKIVFTTKYLENFNETNVGTFKQCFMQQLNCKSEAQLWCKIMLMTYESLSSDTVDSLKNAAIEINHSNHVGTRKQTATNGKNYSLNRLSVLSLARIGSFLTKTESLKLGYINRDLYIQTQKRSYLLKRHERYQMIIQEADVFSKLSDMINNFAYSAPYSLTLQANSRPVSSRMHKWMMSDWFQILFKNLRTCSVENSKFLPFVPSHWLFNRNLKNILDLTLHFDSAQHVQTDIINTNVNKFIASYQDYFTNGCQSNLDLIRKVDKLCIIRSNAPSLSNLRIPGHTRPETDLTETENTYIKPLLLSLGCNYKKLCLKQCGMIKFDNIKELESVFHEKLEELKIDCRTELILTASASESNVRYEKQSLTSNLKYLSLKLNHQPYENYHHTEFMYERLDRMVKQLDMLQFRHNVATCCVRSGREIFLCNQINRDMYDQISIAHESLLTRMFFSDNTPLLKRMYVQIKNDTSWLALTSLYFKYFCVNKEKLLNWNQLSEPKFVCFELIFEQFGDYIFENVSTEDIDEISQSSSNALTIGGFNFDNESFDKLYRFVVDWLRRIKGSKVFSKHEVAVFKIVVTSTPIDNIPDYFVDIH